MSDLPTVTIGIPCLNEERHIEAAVTAALGQDYPPAQLEVLVADGGSTDDTLRILGWMAEHDSRLRVVTNAGRIQACGMNEIIKQARGDVIVRMDAHADYAPDYLRSCVDVMRETGADVVGGAQRARAETSFQRALCAVLSSPLGVGGAAYRDATKEGWVDTVWLGAFRREVFETAGLYDACAVTNEDAELNQRVLACGGRIYLSPRVVGHYYPRNSVRALSKQYRRYGDGRARTLLKHGGFPKLRPIVPFLALVSGAIMVATRSFLLVPSVALYGVLTGLEALRVTRHELSSFWLAWALLPVLHVSHGLGFAVGLVRHAGRAEKPVEHLAHRSHLTEAVR